MQNDRPPGSRRPAPRGQASTGRRAPLSEQQTSVQPRRPRPATPSRQAAPGRRPRRWTRIAGRILIATILLGLFGAGALAVTGYVLYQRSASALGDISALINQDYGGAKIYDRNGTLLYEFEDKDSGLHQHVPLSQISPWVVKATIATEDASFYSNPGVNIRGLIRAGLENLIPGRRGLLHGSGGSSITQQLVKNVLIPEEDRYDRNVDRKVTEAVLAIEITRRYSKDQILEWYLNQIYYGNRAYGIGAAAERYFGVSADKLDLAQASLLVGIPQSPVAYDPILNPDAARQRQAEVLDLMVKHGQATPAQAAAARDESLSFAQGDTATALKAPHWVFYVQDELVRRFGEAATYRGGLRVTTTLDLNLQEQGEKIVDKWVTEFEKQDCGCHNGALVAIDNNTGEILTMVGSRDFSRKDIQGEVNNATAIKQPGSALKPAVYLAAFEKGWSPATVVWDVPRSYPNPGSRPFVPVGPTSQYNGPVTVRQALGSSLNAPAVSAAAFAGVPAVIDTAHKLGISTLNDPENYGVAIATGGANVTLLDMTYMYSTLANGGTIVGAQPLGAEPRKLDPVALLKVQDGRGRTLYEYREPQREQVVSPQLAYLITSILSDDNARSLIYSPGIFNLRDGRPIAAKTGTQQGQEVSEIRSTWNFGYVPDLTVGVWVGNADGSLVRNISSASSSLRIWRDFMQTAVDQLKIPAKPFPVPQGIVKAPVSVPGPNGCRTVEDLFVAGQAPRQQTGQTDAGAAAGTGACRTVRIDTRNGLLAGPDTPEEFVKEVAYVDAPADVADWLTRAGIRTGAPPSATSTITPVPTPSPTPTATPTATPAPTLPARVVTPRPGGPLAGTPAATPAQMAPTPASPVRTPVTATATPAQVQPVQPAAAAPVQTTTPPRQPGPPFYTPVPPDAP